MLTTLANMARSWRWLDKTSSCIAFGMIVACGIASVDAADSVRFNRDVLPILAENCYACHGTDKAAREADLRLDQRESAILDRDGTHAIAPGRPVQSELWKRIVSSDPQFVMPPPETGRRLNEAQREVLRRWVSQGAAYEPHWAYIPPQHVEPPELPGSESEIDRFVRSRLLQEGLQPSPPADRVTLIRRISLDLIGLPPTPLEVDAFVSDSRADAFDRVVQRLLASEHFGERWARWWLDLAHYADSDGYLQDFVRPTAWRYRQWVVDALNRDVPFDRFTIEQLAGDLLPAATIQQRIATGFLRNTLSNREGGADLEEYRVRQAVDRTVTVGTVWLALTAGCAECHDHKFDAITQREFYQLYAFFNSLDEVNLNAPLPEEAEPYRLAKAAHDRKRAELLAPVVKAIAELQADWERRLMDAEVNPNADFAWQRALEVLGLTWGQGQGEGQLEGVNIIKTPLAQRTPEQRERLMDYFLANAPELYGPKLEQIKASELRTKLAALKTDLPEITRAPTITQTNQPRPTHMHIRGDFRRRGEEVSPGTLASLPALPVGQKADRLAFAQWLVSPKHPLTARVTVNRLWQELFGRGLVATSENFGVRGERPSHPELLDWLAIEFVQNGWSLKETLRQIVLSETYRQSSQSRPELAERDPANRLLARQTRLRLSAETVRDVTLASSGLLNRTLGGPSVKPPQPASVTKEGFDNKWETSAGADRYRRGLYTFIQRTSPFAQFVTFDFPDTSRSCTRRERANSPLQALNLLNDPVFVEAAQALAARIWNETRGDDAQRLNHAFLLTISRPPQPEETKRLLAYLQQQQAHFESEDTSVRDLLQKTIFEGNSAERAAWVALASVLLNLDEFITRE
ncbi:MAG: PSD1 and planctomycete cytochrome C domain-containing protein [Pirellulales bacterium]